MKHWLTVLIEMDTFDPSSDLETILENGAEAQDYDHDSMEVEKSLADYACRLTKQS